MLEASQQRSQQMLSDTISQFASTLSQFASMQAQTLSSIILSSSSIQPSSFIHSPSADRNTPGGNEDPRGARVGDSELSSPTNVLQDHHAPPSPTQGSVGSPRRAAVTSLQDHQPPLLPPREEAARSVQGEESDDDEVSAGSPSAISASGHSIGTPRSIITPIPKRSTTTSSPQHSSTRSQQRDIIDRTHLSEGAWREEEFYINQLSKEKSPLRPSAQNEGITRAADFNIPPPTVVNPRQNAEESILEPSAAESCFSNQTRTSENLILEFNKSTRRTGAAKNLKPPTNTQQTDLVRGAISNSVSTEQADIARNDAVVMEQSRRSWAQSPGEKKNSEPTTVTREYSISPNNYSTSSPVPIIEVRDPSAQTKGNGNKLKNFKKLSNSFFRSVFTRKKAGRSEDKASSEIVRKHSYYIPL